MLPYVRFLLTAQVDVSVELLGVLEKWVRVGARPRWMGTGGARAMEEQSEGGDAAPPPSSCTLPLRPQGQATFKADPSGMGHMQEYVLREAGASETSNRSCCPNTGDDGQAMVLLWLGMSMTWGLDPLEGSAGHPDES